MRIAEQGDLPLSVRDRIAENDARKKILTERLADAPVLNLPSREQMIAELPVDARRIVEEPDCIRELLEKYIVRVDIGDVEIIVHAVADMVLHQQPFEVIDGGLHPRTIAKNEQNKRLATTDDSCKHDELPRWKLLCARNGVLVFSTHREDAA